MDKITRGFHRIGIVAAVLFLLFAALAAAWFGIDEPSLAVGVFIAGLVLGLGVYCAARALAWIVKGFVG